MAEEDNGDGHTDEAGNNFDRKKAADKIKGFAQNLGVPFNKKPLSEWSAEQCEALLLRLHADAEDVKIFNARTLTLRRAQLQDIVKSYRFANINECLRRQGEYTMQWMALSLDWKALTSDVRPIDVFLTQQIASQEDDELESQTGTGNPVDGSDGLDAATASLRDELQELRHQLQTLRRERGPAPDDEEDKAAGGNRIRLPEDLRARLPTDPVRSEMEKFELTSLLRSYPPPLDYYTKGGTLSAEEKAKLDKTSLELHNKLGKYVSRYSEVARPLLGLASMLQQNLNEGVEVTDCEAVLDVVFDTIKILFHHNSAIEKERRALQFKDSAVLQSIFSKQPPKSMLNETELSKLEKIAAQQKVLRDIRKDLNGKKRPRPSDWRKQGGADKKSNATTQSGSNFGDRGTHRGGRGNQFRNPSKGKGKGTPRKQGTGEARGHSTPTAQNP
jgi:hypothetical protein